MVFALQKLVSYFAPLQKGEATISIVTLDNIINQSVIQHLGICPCFASLDLPLLLVEVVGRDYATSYYSYTFRYCTPAGRSMH